MGLKNLFWECRRISKSSGAGKAQIMIINNFYSIVLILLIFTACTSNKKSSKNIIFINKSKIEIPSSLKSLIKKDLDYFRKKNVDEFKKRSFMNIFIETIDEDTIIHVMSSSKLDIDDKSIGYFYIDSVIYTVIGEFNSNIYDKKKEMKAFKVKKNKPDNLKEITPIEDFESWNYIYLKKKYIHFGKLP